MTGLQLETRLQELDEIIKTAQQEREDVLDELPEVQRIERIQKFQAVVARREAAVSFKQKTIGRNATKIQARIWEAGKNAQLLCLANGFIGEDVEMNVVFIDYNRFNSNKLIQTGPTAFKVKVHSNLWYVFEAKV